MKQVQNIVIIFLFGFVSQITAQKLVKESIYSASLKDWVEVKVWLPENYSPEKKYPVIYEFVYDHSNFIAATLDNLFRTPDAIVVFSKFVPGTSYENPSLTKEGEGYYHFVTKEMIPFIKKKYNTLHSTAVGLSQGADYINYILRTDPELFDAYLIYSIESPNYEPDFTAYTDKIKEQKDYYIAISDDVERRIIYANKLYDNLKKSSKLNVVKKEFKQSMHSYSILYGLADGLQFVYKDYTAYRSPKEGERFSDYVYNSIEEIEQRFGSPNYNGLLIHTFNTGAKKSSKEEVQIVVNRLLEDTVNVNDLDFFNLGYMLLEELKFYDLAVNAFNEAVLRAKKLKKIDRQIPLSSSYNYLADSYHKTKNKVAIFNTLKEGFEVTGKVRLLHRQ